MPNEAKKYGTIITNVGAALITQATMEGEKVNLATLAVGDGGGAYYQPTPDMLTLRNERWSGAVNSVSVNPESPNVIDIVAVVPSEVGGWTIREMCVKTPGGDMVAICNTPDTEKVIITSGAAGEIEVTMHITVSNAAAITLVIDPYVVTATKQDITNHNNSPAAHPDLRKMIEEAGGNPYDSEHGYSVGAYCTRGGVMYRCISPVEPGEEWDPSKWVATSIAAELEAARSSILSPEIAVTTYPGATVTCTNGEKTLSKEAGEDGACLFNIPDYGTWTVTATRGGATIKTREIEVLSVTRYIADMKYTRYGYRVKKAESSPSGRVEYLFDAVGKTPARMDYTAGRFNYGDWGDVWFVAGNYPCMLNYDGTEAYKLNPNDYSKKEDGTASDVANANFGGNAMSAIPLCWVKRYEEDGWQYVIFSDGQYDETYKAYAHTNAAGEIKDVAYAPMFEGSIISGKLRSISGQTPENTTTADAEITAATANGAGWNIRTHSLNQLVADLCTLISKTDNSEEAFGTGHNDGGSSASALLQTGGLNTRGQFYGTNTNAAMKIFHCENWYGDRWERIVGLILDNGVYKVKMTPEGDGYNLTGAGYTVVPHTALSGTNGGYIKDSTQTEYGRLPQGALEGSDSTYECDGCWYNNGQVSVALVGGNCNAAAGLRVGVRCLSVNNLASRAIWDIGASLSFINPS